MVAVRVTAVFVATDVAEAARVVVVEVVPLLVLVAAVVELPHPATVARVLMPSRRSAARRSRLGHQSCSSSSSLIWCSTLPAFGPIGFSLVRCFGFLRE